jgi:hypothetical protein
MAVQIQGNKSLNAGQETASGNLLSRPIWPYVGSNGGYSVSMVGGTIAVGIAAGAVIAALRWTHASKICLVTRIRAQMYTLTPPTTAQSWGIDAVIGRSYTASHTGGTAVNFSGNNVKKRTSYASSQMGDMRMITSAALGGGTVTADADPIGRSSRWELVGAATVQHVPVVMDLDWRDIVSHPPILVQNEGILIRNTDLTANTMTYTGVVTFEWLELDTLDVS